MSAPCAALAALLLSITGSRWPAIPQRLRGLLTSTPSDEPPAASRWSASGEPSAGGYRLSVARGGVDVGLDFERRVAAARTADARFDTRHLPERFCPRCRSACAASARRLRRAARRSTRGTDTVPFVSRVGIEDKPAQSQLFVNRGLGFRLSATTG